MRRQIFQSMIVFIVVFGLSAAWISKPEPLGVSFEKAEIYLMPSDVGPPGTYKITGDDRENIRILVPQIGFQRSRVVGLNYSASVYTKKSRLLYFWRLEQKITFDSATPNLVLIEPPLR